MSGGGDDGRGAGRQERHEQSPRTTYTLRVNGVDTPVEDAWIGESLLFALRERLGLAGAKDGCQQGECGACSVLVDGRVVAGCMVPAALAAGHEVRTVEGLSADAGEAADGTVGEPRPSDVQRAMVEAGASPCGYCLPGIVIAAHDLLEGDPEPTPRQIREALSGNLCRCGGLPAAREAVREVAAARARAKAGAAATATATASDTGEGA